MTMMSKKTKISVVCHAKQALPAYPTGTGMVFGECLDANRASCVQKAAGLGLDEGLLLDVVGLGCTDLPKQASDCKGGGSNACEEGHPLNNFGLMEPYPEVMDLISKLLIRPCLASALSIS